MATSRKGLTKIKQEPQADLIEIKGEIKKGFVYIVDYVINDNIASKSPTSHAIGYEDMFISDLKKQFPKIKIESILIKNPRYPQKQVR